MKIIKKITEFIKNNRSARFILKGSCKKCGICCKNITFMIGEQYLTDKKEFERIKQLDSKYNNFFISGRDENNILLFTCKALKEDNTCSCYSFRSLYCRLYPGIKTKHIRAGAEMLKGCGYYIESNVKFEEFLK